MMDLMRLVDHYGKPFYLQVSQIESIRWSLVDGVSAITTKTRDTFAMSGSPDEVHEIIFGKK